MRRTDAWLIVAGVRARWFTTCDSPRPRHDGDVPDVESFLDAGKSSCGGTVVGA